MSSYSKVLSGLVTTLALVIGMLVVPAQPAEAQAGSRMCYFNVDGTPYYFERERDIHACSFWEWKGATGRNVPTLMRNGEWHDMSICENFTKYLLGGGKVIYTSGDVCKNMRRLNGNTMGTASIKSQFWLEQCFLEGVTHC